MTQWEIVERGLKEYHQATFAFDITWSRSYEWKIAKIFTVKDGRRKPKVFYLVQGGCSCNFFGSNWYSADSAMMAMRELVTLNDAKELIKQFEDVTAFRYDELVNKFRGLKLR